MCELPVVDVIVEKLMELRIKFEPILAFGTTTRKGGFLPCSGKRLDETAVKAL